MKRTVFFFFLLIPGWSVFAQFSLSDGETPQQVVFPVLKEYSDKNLRILPTWTPSKQFLKDNPNFLKDGSYKLNSGMMRKNEPLLMDAYPFYSSRFINMNSGNFPATIAESTKKLDFLDMVHFTFTLSDDSNVDLPLARKKSLVEEVSSEIYGHEHLVKRYDDCFAGAAKEIVSKKGIAKYEVSPIPSSLYGEKEMHINSLVLDFQCLGVWSYTKKNKSMFWYFVPIGAAFIPATPNFWAFWFAKHNGGDYYPSNAIYQLNVRDVTGNLIKSYRQAIFIGERHKYFMSNSIYLVNRQLLLASMPTAMESLVNRFLNDEQTLATTKKHLVNLTQKKADNPNLLELAKAQAKVNMLYRRKSSFIWRMAYNAEYIKQLGNNSQLITQSMSNQQQLSNAIYTDPNQHQLNNLGLSAAGLAGNLVLKGSINKSARESDIIAELFRTTSEAETLYLNEIAQLIQNDKDLAALVGKSKSVDQFFQDELTRVAKAKEESKQQLQAVNKQIQQSFSKTLTDFAARNNIDLAQMSAIAAGETPPTNGGGAPATAKSGKAATDACARQSETAWRNSAEYKKWKSTGLQADAYMATWKQGALILQYCGSMLPEADKTAIRNASEQARRNAETMRKSNTGGIRF